MPISLEQAGVIVAITISIGGIGYQAIAMKKDVDTLRETANNSEKQLDTIQGSLNQLEIKYAESNRDILAQKTQMSNIGQTQVEILKTVNGSAALVEKVLTRLLEERPGKR